MFKWLNFNRKNKPVEQPQEEAVELSYKEDKRSIQYKLKRTYAYRTELQMRKLKSAIQQAENLQNPRRIELYALYKEAMRDAHVFSQIRTLRNKLSSAPFELLNPKGKVDEQKQEELLNAPWLVEYFKHWMDAYFWGHSLVEVLFKDGEVHTVGIVPREHVHPWSGQVVINTSDTKGIPYRKPPLNKQLIEVGAPEDLGLLLIITREVIWKNAARGDWSRYAEKFGMPFLLIKTGSNVESENDKKAKMANDFGANSWAIIDDDDEFELLENSKTDAYKVYYEQARFCDEQISKLIVGQTGTSDEKSFVGSAEVHERVLDTYIWAMLRALQFHFNHELIPFLTKNGYPLADYKVKFTELDRKAEATPGQETTPQKKKTELSIQLPSLEKLCCQKPMLTLADKPLFNLSKITEQAIESVHKKKLKAGELDANIWKYNVQKILTAVERGSEQTYASLDYDNSYHDLLRELRRNVYTFAAFKNYHNINDMVDALTDEDGKLKNFSTFKEEAMQLNKIYNENWLNSEYNSAVGNAQMAVKWKDIQDNADLFPWIQYVAIQDDRTRAAHAELHGITLRYDDEFWEEFFPPNGWNCRCTIRTYANAEELRPDGFPSVDDVPPEFRHNTGKDGNLYSEDHPYFKQTTKETRTKIMATMRSFVLQEKESYASSLALMKSRPQIFKSYPKLTKDDAASLHFYTGRNFQQFNLRLRYNRLTDFELYLKDNLTAALDKLPNYKGEAYRVMTTNVRPDFILQLIESGSKEFVDQGFASSSYNAKWAAKKLELGNTKWTVAMRIQSKTGKVIEQFSKKGRIFNKGQNQFEVLFKPGTVFNIDKVEMEGNSIVLLLTEK